MIFCWCIWCISLLSRNKAKKKKRMTAASWWFCSPAFREWFHNCICFLPILPQCDFCKVIIPAKDGLDLGSEIFLLNTAVLMKCNPRTTAFSCTNETGRASGHSESKRGNWAVESVGHQLWEEWNHLSGRLEVNYLVKIEYVITCQMHQATWGKYVNMTTVDHHQINALVI